MLLAVVTLLLAILLGGCLGSDEASNHPNDVGTETAIVRAHGVELQLEPGWQAAERSLTPTLMNPRELLSVGTMPMRPGACATVPRRAIAAMGPGDALITIQERDGARPEDFPPRPQSFRVHPGVGNFECAPQDLKVAPFIFREAGRYFYALVVIERGAPIREAEAILDSFEAQPVAN
jgi:hypothetical protein